MLSTSIALACDVHSRVAVERLYQLKRRRLDKPSAVMFFDRELALAAFPELGARTRAALGRLLPEGGYGQLADGDRTGLARQQMFGEVLGLLAELAAAAPVLTPSQRVELAGHLRLRASHTSRG